MTRPWDKHSTTTACRPGEHTPIRIVANQGDPPVRKYNRCGACGHDIYKMSDGRWVIDTGERKRWDAGNSSSL